MTLCFDRKLIITVAARFVGKQLEHGPEQACGPDAERWVTESAGTWHDGHDNDFIKTEDDSHGSHTELNLEP